jgi:glutamate formiminotransferase/glutamate formiminotransferase/formiminotetrahydrofolate cyclodeaminase
VPVAVPNVSEGRDATAIERIGTAFAGAARLLDVHSDPDHNRTVYWLAGGPGALAQSLVDGAAEALERIDVHAHEGVHPFAGALDVAPVVWLTPEERGAACAEALLAADRLGDELGLPVFLYGLLAGGRTRAELRRGGPAELARRIEAGELRPDFGPARLHPRGGAVLVAARPPLVAFNVELAPPATLDDARAVAAAIREGGADGLPGVRALGLQLVSQGGTVQVSTNVEDHRRVSLAEVVAAVGRRAPVAGCELVGLAPRAAFAGFPEDVAIRGRQTVEDALQGLSS